MSTESRSPPNIDQGARIILWGRALLLVVLVGMFGTFMRVVQLKLVPNQRLSAAVGSPISTRIEMNRRGDLLDRTGRVVATSTVGYRLFIDPQAVSDPYTVALEVAAVTALDPIEVDKKLQANAHRRYVVIDEQLDGWQVEAIRKANLKGVGLDPRLIRHYPHVDLAAGIIGKVGSDHHGQAGFEHVFNSRMLPELGKLTYLRDVRRQALWIDPNDYEPGADGRDVRLSVDLVIQEIAEKRLRQAVDEYHAGGGRLVVLDCRSGEILAMCDFLNARRGWNEQTDDPARAIDPALGRNRCITDPYEPGSTFKPFIWAVATELGKARLDELLPLPEGPWTTPYGRVIRDAHYYGPLTWRMVLVKSSNSGMA
ncbi:MAG: hypothetical protein L0219_05380, partial [Phycisphaerales bacterium]|nr:hypothetical protein [Phycisphaerales bacterium]MCI0676436.1 hypothetical protein [Phycisphaerales bacterium]